MEGTATVSGATGAAMIEELKTVQQLKALPPDQQIKAVERIYAGPDHPLFVQIRDAFLHAFPQSNSAEVFCGMASQLGPMHAITVTTQQGQRLVGLPRLFLGMQVIRRTHGRSGTWLPSGRR